MDTITFDNIRETVEALTSEQLEAQALGASLRVRGNLNDLRAADRRARIAVERVCPLRAILALMDAGKMDEAEEALALYDYRAKAGLLRLYR